MEYLVKSQFAVDATIYNVDDIVDMEVEEAKALVEEGKLEKYVEEKSVVVSVDTDCLTKAIQEGFEKFAPKPIETDEKSMDFGDFLVALSTKSLSEIEQKTVNITTGTQGGNATTRMTDRVDTDIMSKSAITSMLSVIELSGTDNTYRFNVVTSVGTAPAVVAESSSTSLSQPVIATFNLTLVKNTYAYVTTYEAQHDVNALVQEINSVVPEAFAKFLEGGVINGETGVTAIIGHAQTATIAKEGAQTASTIVTANVTKMFNSCKSPSQSVWVVSRSAYAQVMTLEDTNGNALFVGPQGYGPSPFGTLLGIRIEISDFAQAVGTVGDILLCNFNKYRLVVKGPLDIAVSEHVSFLDAEDTYRFIKRWAGSPIGILQTATDGTEISDFVELAERV